MTGTTDRLASPGAFRLLLAMGVFLHHTTSFNIGMTAVLVFFVLSGYWVATMWSSTYSKTNLSYFTYLVSRIWRVTPVFALCSAISWALLWWRGASPAAFGSIAHQLFSNVMILGYNSLPYQANVPGWSLDMEVQFYLIAPLMIFLVSRNVYLLAACVMISAFSQKLGGATTVAPFLYFFGIGIVAATFKLEPSRKVAYGSLIVTLLVFLVSTLLLFKNIALGETTGHILAFTGPANTLIAVMMVPWALYTTRQQTGAQDRMLGDLSYIFYLLHWSVIGLMKTGEGSYAMRVLLCTEAMIIILGASWIIWRVFDHPINRARAAWVKRRLTGYAPLHALGAKAAAPA